MLTLFFDPITAYRILMVTAHVIVAVALLFGTVCAVVLIQRSLAWAKSDALVARLERLGERYCDYMEDHALGLDKPAFMKPTIGERLHLAWYKARRAVFYADYRVTDALVAFQARWQPLHSDIDA